MQPSIKDSSKLRFYTLSPGEKEKVIDLIRELLLKDDNIVCAILFGGFLKDRPFRDIDIAVILDNKIADIIESYNYLSDLAEKLERNIGFPIDFVDIRFARDWIRIRIFKEGLVLVDKDPILRLRYKLCTWDNDLSRIRSHKL